MEQCCLPAQSALEPNGKKRVDQSDELYRRLTLWHKPKDTGEDLPDVQLHDLETAWRAWTLGEAFGWQILPFGGGYLEQPEALMEDMLRISAVSRKVKENASQRT